jgi:hypothetical protein
MLKLAGGLLSERYSTTPQPVFQECVRPVTFKVLFRSGQAEFVTMR